MERLLYITKLTTSKFSFFLNVLFCLALTPGCVDSSKLSSGIQDKKEELELPEDIPAEDDTPPADSSLGSFDGCDSGEGISTTSIRVNFDFIPGASRMNIYRDGSLAFNTSTPSDETFVDAGLTSGISYRYTCAAVFGDESIFGLKALNLTPVSYTPPTFTGIDILNSYALNSSAVVLMWIEPVGGTPVKSYKVYQKLGSSVDWTAEPVRTLQKGISQVVLTGFGDELPYAFGVRACNASGLCDQNILKAVVTIPDNGAPGTPGALSASLDINGTATISAPWQAASGAVKTRQLYAYSGLGDPSDFANYSLDSSYTIADITNPKTTFTYSGVPDNQTVYFIVRDVDPLNQNNNSVSYVSVSSGDRNAPIFSGITNLTNVLAPPVDSETKAIAQWTAINNQPADPDGVTSYLVYVTVAQPPAVPTSACAEGTSIYTQIPSSTYTSGAVVNYTVVGLQGRSNYNVCVKARDAAGNISSTSASRNITTKDVTAPVFAGVTGISYDYGTSSTTVTWLPSSSNDVDEYHIKIWKNTATPAPGDITTVVRDSDSFPMGSGVSIADFSISDNDVVYAVVWACDDASPLYNTGDNCYEQPYAEAESFIVPDLTPPQGFAGVNNVTAPSEGTLRVFWPTPVAPNHTWSDYAGFKIYNVNADNSISLLTSCMCTGNDCTSNPINSCDLTGLNVRRTYTIHVRAIDAATNIAVLNPIISRFARQTKDETAPTFTPVLQASISGGAVDLTWVAANDLQYALEAGAEITYELYRKTNDAVWADPTDPTGGVDGVAFVYESTDPFFTDSDGTAVAQGNTLYYVVCARDATGNKVCPPRDPVMNITIPDVTPPTITGLRTNKKLTDGTWTLSWTAADNAPGDVTVQIHRGNHPTCPTGTSGVTLQSQGNNLSSYADTGSVAGPNYCYTIVAIDQSNNRVTATINDLNPAPTVTDVVRTLPTAADPAQSSQPELGGDTIQITGTGFLYHVASGQTLPPVTMRSAGETPWSCGSVAVNSATSITCVTTDPPKAGYADVRVTNFDGQYGEESNGFFYPSFCDLYGGDSPWAGSSAGLGGSGTPGSPYRICSVAQLTTANNGGYRSSAFKMMADLDATAYAGGSLWGENDGDAFQGNFDGNYKTIDNFTGSKGFIKGAREGAVVKNLNLTNISATGGGTNTGGIIGKIKMNGAGTITLSNISLEGSIGNDGTQYVGGLIGRYETNGGNVNINDCHVDITLAGGQYSGGLIGAIQGNTTITNSSTAGTFTSNGDRIGGFIGQASGGTLVETSFSEMTVIYTSGGNATMGGFVGALNGATIRNSYATGDVMATNSSQGDAAGFSGEGGGTIQNSYSTGFVTNTSSSEGFGTTCSSSYYDTETSAKSTGCGSAKTTADMRTQSTFSGWNFDDIWIMPTSPTGYPKLRGVSTGY